MKLNKVEQPQRVFKNVSTFLAFGLGSGLSPIVPGTMGTLAAIPFYLLLTLLPWWAYAIVVVMASVLGVFLCGKAAELMNVHDHPGIVWDEFVGFWITMFLVPLHWQWVALGFVIFRFFDMLKPWPISIADRKVHGGFGIMLDDILAGVAAWISLQAIIYFV